MMLKHRILLVNFYNTRMLSLTYIYTMIYSTSIIFLLILFCLVIPLVILGLSAYFSPKKTYKEKTASYECGFNPFRDARMRLDIRYYLVAILFIIFDLEIIFLFPWSVSFFDILLTSPFGHACVLFFIFLLTIGFCYEWRKGALEW